MFLTEFMEGYESLLHFIAGFTVHTLELIGISIIIIGSVKAMLNVLNRIKNKQKGNAMIVLGRALALALEFKMGAEIVNTVRIRELKELATLAIVIALRAVLAILIHWELKNEQKEERALSEKSDNTTDSK